MKANVDFPKRVKNSFIYFQVGLIATMVVILFILEFNFENKTKKITYIPPVEINPEQAFIYNPAPKLKQIETSKPVVFKVPKTAHIFKATKEEPIKEDISVPEESENIPETQNKNTPEVPKNNEKATGEFTAFSVEKLPVFDACRGLSRAAQKDCFDSQMAKAIAKNLVYPESDLENGKQGVAQVEFIIDEKGVITNIKVLDNKRATASMMLAAEKAVKKIPKLMPAMQGDKPVKIKYTIPVGFRLK